MRKNLKKLAALGLAFVMGAALLAGCESSGGGDSSGSGGKTKLTLGIWDENQRPAMEALVEAYEAENEDVTVEIQLTPYKGSEYWTKLEASATGGKARSHPRMQRRAGRCVRHPDSRRGSVRPRNIPQGPRSRKA